MPMHPPDQAETEQAGRILECINKALDQPALDQQDEPRPMPKRRIYSDKQTKKKEVTVSRHPQAADTIHEDLSILRKVTALSVFIVF